jgi:tRNA(Ile)-lysidine synthase
LLTLLKRTLHDECAVARGDVVLCAVSGGPDSMALLHALSRLAPKLGLELCAHGVDHGLRPEASTELDLAASFARALGISFSRAQLRVPEGGNLQARARAARYAALRAVASQRGARWIATAHHADDRAETVLLRLLRGTKARGLGVLPPRDGDLLRPMVRARRSDVLAHVARHAIPHADDPSNRNTRFLRTRVRGEVLPLLEELNPGIVAHLCALADELCTDRAQNTAQAAQAAQKEMSQIRQPARSRAAAVAAHMPAQARAARAR